MARSFGALRPRAPAQGNPRRFPWYPSGKEASTEMNVLGACFRSAKTYEQTITAWHNGGICRCVHHAASITCREFGGALRPRRGARGAEPPRNKTPLPYA